MVNSVDPEETSHLDLHCLQRYPYWSVEIKVTFSIFETSIRNNTKLFFFRLEPDRYVVY